MGNTESQIQDEVLRYFEEGPVKADGTHLYYEGPGQLFTAEDIAERNEKERRRNEDAMELIKADGFIRYPLFFQDVDGNLVEKEAWLHPEFEPSCSEGFFEKHQMNFNIYVPSYERAGEAGTMKMLDRFGVKNYYICIDASQYAKYKEVYPIERIVIRDISFRDPDMLDPVSSVDHPITMAGHAPLCNFTLALSRSLGESHFWFMDDDFFGLAMKAHRGHPFYELDEDGNQILDGEGNPIPKRDENGDLVRDITKGLQPNEVYDKDNFFRCSNIMEDYGFDFQKFMTSMEEFTKKMRNPGFVGLEKFGTVFSLPVCWRNGTRVYSYYLTTNKTQVTHLGRQNNDVITSLELSKHGLVNMLFEGISYNSGATQSGGGQSEMYGKFGTLDKGKILVRAQPNYSKISYEYSRIHHNCDFTNLNQQRLVGEVIRDED